MVKVKHKKTRYKEKKIESLNNQKIRKITKDPYFINKLKIVFS